VGQHEQLYVSTSLAIFHTLDLSNKLTFHGYDHQSVVVPFIYPPDIYPLLLVQVSGQTCVEEF